MAGRGGGGCRYRVGVCPGGGIRLVNVLCEDMKLFVSIDAGGIVVLKLSIFSVEFCGLLLRGRLMFEKSSNSSEGVGTGVSSSCFILANISSNCLLLSLSSRLSFSSFSSLSVCDLINFCMTTKIDDETALLIDIPFLSDSTCFNWSSLSCFLCNVVVFSSNLYISDLWSRRTILKFKSS